MHSIYKYEYFSIIPGEGAGDKEGYQLAGQLPGCKCGNKAIVGMEICVDNPTHIDGQYYLCLVNSE